MLQMKRSIILETIEEIIVSYDFLTDAKCVKVLDNALLDLTKRQFCWNDIRDETLRFQHKFGNDQKINTFVLWIDYNSQHMKITIFKTIWNYYLSK